MEMKKRLLLSNNLRNNHYRTRTNQIVKKMNRESSEILKRLQGKYVVVGEPFS